MQYEKWELVEDGESIKICLLRDDTTPQGEISNSTVILSVGYRKRNMINHARIDKLIKRPKNLDGYTLKTSLWLEGPSNKLMFEAYCEKLQERIQKVLNTGLNLVWLLRFI